jgi:hypothetical protein
MAKKTECKAETTCKFIFSLINSYSRLVKCFVIPEILNSWTHVWGIRLHNGKNYVDKMGNR